MAQLVSQINLGDEEDQNETEQFGSEAAGWLGNEDSLASDDEDDVVTTEAATWCVSKLDCDSDAEPQDPLMRTFVHLLRTHRTAADVAARVSSQRNRCGYRPPAAPADPAVPAEHANADTPGRSARKDSEPADPAQDARENEDVPAFAGVEDILEKTTRRRMGGKERSAWQSTKTSSTAKASLHPPHEPVTSTKRDEQPTPTLSSAPFAWTTASSGRGEVSRKGELKGAGGDLAGATAGGYDDIVDLLRPPPVPVSKAFDKLNPTAARIWRERQQRRSDCEAPVEDVRRNDGDGSCTEGVARHNAHVRAQVACLVGEARDAEADIASAAVADVFQVISPAKQDALLELLLSWYYSGFFSGRASLELR